MSNNYLENNFYSIEVNCPYCEMVQSMTVGTHYHDFKLCKCKLENGGCGKTFAIESSITVDVISRKIEGQESQYDSLLKGGAI